MLLHHKELKMSINDIVVINITRQTASVSRVGFGTINILGINKGFTPLIKYYASLSEVASDFDSTSKEYIASSDAFAQNPRVAQVAISRRGTSDTSVVTVSTVVASTNYTITINGLTFTFNSGLAPTAITIGAGLVALINASIPLAVTATDNLDGTFDLDPDVLSTAYSVKIESKLTIAFSTSTTIDWYGLVYTERTLADVKACMDWIEGQLKVFATASADAVIKDSTLSTDVTSIAWYANSQALDRSLVFYHANAGTEYLDAGFLAVCLVQDPGSYTGKFKTIASVTVDNINTTQQKNVEDKKANTYLSVAQNPITSQGTVGGGEFFDVIVFVDWLQARMQERIFGVLINTLKVPFTDAGISSIEVEIRAQLQDGIDAGGLTSDPAPTVSVPKASAISALDKANRELNGITFLAYLAGAIHKITIQGTVSV
jgi:hypothetical protein